jgi:hypothetical protein
MAANYNVTLANSTNGVINTRAITVTVNSGQTKIHGTLDPLPFTFSIGGSGLASTDEFTGLLTRVSGESVLGSPYAISQGNLSIRNTATFESTINNYYFTFTGANFTITQASTTTTLLTSAGSVRYMDNLTMTARIKPLNTGSALTGTVVFKIGTVTYAPVSVIPIPGATDGTVQAMLIKQVSQLPGGPYTVEAIFTSSNSNYSGGNDSKQLTVVPRTATPYVANGFYTGDLFAWTTGQSSSTATLTMTAAIRDVSTPTGDVRSAKVSFYMVNGTTLSPISSAQNLPVGLVDVSDGSVGTASAIVQLNIGSANAASFQIAVKVTGAYTNNPTDAVSQTIVTVSKPIAGGYIVGGGQVGNTNSSGYLKGAFDMNTCYQFDIQYTKSGTNPKGKTNIMVKSYNKVDGTLDTKLHTYLITTNAISLLNVGTPNATGTFSAKANLVEQLEDLSTVAIEGGATFQMIAFQKACNQQIAITLYRKAGGVWFSSNWSASSAKTDLAQVTSTSTVYVYGGGVCSSSQSVPVARMNTAVNSTQVDTPAPTLFFDIKASPNPTTSHFNAKLESDNISQPISLNVVDISGKVIEMRKNLVAGQTFQLGANYRPGMYFVELLQGDRRRIVKLVKQPD